VQAFESRRLVVMRHLKSLREDSRYAPWHDSLAEEELLRVVQEAVHNCVKHAHPQHVDIRLAGVVGDPGSLVVEVEDGGVGFEPDAPHPGHLGLDTMRERTERLGGRLVVESSAAGSRVRAVLPGS
jgi:signal transduction histidine kinase